LTAKLKAKFTEELRVARRKSQARFREGVCSFSEEMSFRLDLPKIRIVPGPDERMRTLTRGADQAEAWADKAHNHVQPLFEKLYSVRRRLATGTVTILAIWLLIHVTFGANGMSVYRGKRAEYQNLQKQIDHLEKENAEYSEQVTELKSDPKRIEKEAREQFHYVRPGEVVYVAPDPPVPAVPATRSASK
jgi:cell division protein FtsB